MACIVLDDIPQGNSLRNVAEITKNSNENREDVKDIDSTPDTVDPDNYPGDDKEQDDNDYELLVPEAPKKFDLALQKFITRLNDNNITDRVPKVSIQDGKISYEHKDTSLPVANGDLVTYTIRVYNEGEADGYAAEVADNLPDGLTFVADNDINKQYGWKLYDKNGKETSDLKQAVSVKTDYLSKEKSEARNENCLIKAFDTNKGITATNPDYRDVVLVLKVETEASNKNDIINVAEITDDTDKDGNPVDDVDSVPGNNKKDEDDIDEEKVRLQEFDLSLQKFITRLNNNEIKDRIPAGLEFYSEDNPGWTILQDGIVTTDLLANTLLKPGESATVEIKLRWKKDQNNLGLKVNTAEISKDENEYGTPDIDSTPDNNVDGEDDQDTAPVILSIITGSAPTYIVLTITVMTILATGFYTIKKYVL